MAVNVNSNYKADDGSRSFISGGTLSFATINASTDVVESGYDSMGYCASVDISFETTKAENVSSLYGAKEIVATVVTDKTGTINITLNDYQKSNLANALYGSVTDNVAAAAEAESIVAKLDRHVPLSGFLDATGTMTVKDVTDVTTYVEDTDYVVSDGSIYFVDGGAISEDDVIHVVYDKLAESVIEAFTVDNLILALYFDGVNLDNSKRTKSFFHKVQLDPTSSYNLLAADEYATLELTGTLLSSKAVSATGLSKFYKEIIEA